MVMRDVVAYGSIMGSDVLQTLPTGATAVRISGVLGFAPSVIYETGAMGKECA